MRGPDRVGSFESNLSVHSKLIIFRTDWASELSYVHFPKTGEHRASSITHSRISDTFYVGTEVTGESQTQERYFQPVQEKILSGAVSVGVAF